MQIRNVRSTAKPATSDKRDELLECRLAMLGLDFDAVKRSDGKTLDRIMRQCASCDVRQACTVDLKRDPNNPVWETYCPNAQALVALAEARWKAL
jgi:hypothetical protein